MARFSLGWRVSVAVVGLMSTVFTMSLVDAGGARTTRPAVSHAGFRNRVFASGARIKHRTKHGMVAISQPDDITALGGHIFVGFQNGVGPQGEASTTGNRDSTVVEFSRSGRKLNQWDVVGKCDGLTAIRTIGGVIATVNEDAHSSLYVIKPGHRRAVHYRYNVPLPSKGGTDAISLYRGMILISASAPGTTGKAAPQPGYPAVYRAVLNTRRHIATVHGLFSDEATATLVNARGSGKRVRLGLTDPDSNEVVPAYAPRFGGDFMLTSQGDKEQIFVSRAGTSRQTLSVLKISDSVDDTAWPSSSSGAILTTDNGRNTVNEITGPFRRGTVYVADTPCDADGAPATCPAKAFPANYLGRLNARTGQITRVPLRGPAVAPQGMLFLR
jgi:hypothetical protein